MDEYVRVIDEGVIRVERLVKGPIERVWDYLVESDKRGKWLARGEMEPRVGGKVVHIFQHENLSDEPDSIPEKYCTQAGETRMEGTVTAFDPPRLLSYTWGESDGSDSEVKIELEARGAMVHIALTHFRIPESEMIGVAAGWHGHLDILVDRLQKRPTKPFWKTHMQLEEVYELRLKK